MKEMPQKIKIAKITFYVAAIWGLVMPTLFFIGTFYLIEKFSFKTIPQEIIILFFSFMILIGIIGGIIYLFIAKAINKQKQWAKTVGIVFGALSVFSFPLGTIFGILVLLGLLSKEADSWFIN